MPAKSKRTTNAMDKPRDAINLYSRNKDKPRFTGQSIVTMDANAKASSVRSFSRKASLNMASIRDFDSKPENIHEAFDQGDGIYFDAFKIAIVNSNKKENVERVSMTAAGSGVTTEPERFVYATPIAKKIPKKKVETNSKSFLDNTIATWGVQAIKILNSQFTGKGVNLAILDTGLNVKHPDFARLTIKTKSFITGQAVEDKNGHGTHCSGISVGGIQKSTNLRYGVAVDSNLFIGKVLSNAGSGKDRGIIAGLEWALQNKCKVISMSLGSAVGLGETFSPAYERVAKVALANGTVIVAAAGNESRRQFGQVEPVGHPANCPSIMAVAALDNNLQIASFSCGGFNPDGGQVDIGAPGVNIFSSWKNKGYNTISGTSMATPFVAGILATYWEAFPNASAAEIWMMIAQNALRLNLNASDTGAGLAQAR